MYDNEMKRVVLPLEPPLPTEYLPVLVAINRDNQSLSAEIRSYSWD